MKKNKLTKGFTLIELLVVIAIIGILGAIIYAPFQSARRKGRDGQRVIEMKNLVSSLTLYADSHHGYYPCDLAALASTQSDPLPIATATSSTINTDNSYYNYVGYTDGTVDTASNGNLTSSCGVRVVGYHLWTHLETVSGALAGAAKCKGVNNSGGFDAAACINLGTGASIVSGQHEPADSRTSAAFSEASRAIVSQVGDSDGTCATNKAFCILDYHQ
ncbi:MAG: prepilin-type N-terminal cleavage/methylation domain-containing protein [Candidatus Pacebacteria bacterium]|nr:prepilin-type N-terminal cleavage/methylation domain-containing protein [Candidatus Paceibacterota bacterium]